MYKGIEDEKWDKAKLWCNNYSDASGNCNWYLPSKEELNELYKVKNEVNAAIDKIIAGGGTAKKLGTGWYWSSLETSCNFAYVKRFSDGNHSEHFALDGGCVRAVRAFSKEALFLFLSGSWGSRCTRGRTDRPCRGR